MKNEFWNTVDKLWKIMLIGGGVLGIAHIIKGDLTET